jgi:hypothetical protein
MERRLIAARATDVMHAITNFHKALQARIVIREPCIELANRKRLDVADLCTGLAWVLAVAGHGDLLCPLP